MRQISSFCVFVFLTTTSILGQGIVEERHGLSINWGSLRFGFCGRGKLEEGTTYADCVKETTQKTRAEILDRIRAYYQQRKDALVMEEVNIQEAHKRILHATYETKTEIFSDGVLVCLESQLPHLLPRIDFMFKEGREASAEGALFSGIILKLPAVISPRPDYKVVDENGELLYSIENVAKDAYNKRLMGAWFLASVPRQSLEKTVGGRPISLAVSSIRESSTFVVQRKVWEEALKGQEAVLRNSRLAVVVPQR